MMTTLTRATCRALTVTFAGVALGAAAWDAVEQPDLAAAIANAPAMQPADVCEPVRSVRQGLLMMVPDGASASWDVLQIYFPSYGGPNTIVAIDLASGETKQIQTTRGFNFHLAPQVVAPNGKLYISTLGGRLQQQLCVYDPATNDLQLDAIPLPDTLRGETHPLVLGTDGKLYAIGAHTSGAASACQIDPQTHAVVDYGAIGPSHAPNGCWGYSGGADGRYVYIASGKIPWYLVAYDRQTGTAEVLVTTEAVGGMVSVSQGRHGCTATANKVVGTDGARQSYWLHEGKAILRLDAREAPPWPEPEPAVPPAPLPPRPSVNTDRAVPDVEGWAELRVRQADAGDDEPWRVFRYQVPLHPHSIYRLVELPDGRLFGTAGAYEGNFVHDPATGRAEHLGKIHLSHYATAIHDGKVYMSGYPSSPVYAYDWSKPWTSGKVDENDRIIQDNASAANPRMVARLTEAGTHKMYAAAVGADGRVYFGGCWIRNGSAGGLGWWDPETRESGGFWEPFSNLQITHMSAAGAGRYIVISTRRVDDSLLNKPKPDQGRLVVFDTATRELVRDAEPVPNAKGAGLVVGVGGTRVLGWTENPENAKASILYGFDAETGMVAFRKTVPFPLPVAIGSNQQEPFDFRLGPDGFVWTFVGGALVRIDPADARIVPVARLARGGSLAFSGRDAYLGGGTTLRRLAGLLPEP